MQIVLPILELTGPIDWDMLTTWGGEVLVPFAHHVRRPTSSESTHVCNQFLSLPLELQIHIVSFCDQATLFSLMQVSTIIRREASRLFWSNPSVWYYIDEPWLLKGGFLGQTDYNVDALQNFQRIVVEFERGENGIFYEGVWER